MNYGVRRESDLPTRRQKKKRQETEVKSRRGKVNELEETKSSPRRA